MTLAWIALLCAAPCGSASAPDAGIVLPEGALARALSKLERGVLALELAPAAPPSAWGRPETFERWARTLEATAGAEAARARAELAILARAHGRVDDAWWHAEAASADPRALKALLPALLLGPEARPGRDGLLAALPDGAVLAPSVPPRSHARARGRIERRESLVRGLTIGDARVDLRVAVENEGVQVDLIHVGGGTARLALAIPCEEGFRAVADHVDWFRQDAVGVAHALEIGPERPERTLYARFEPAPWAFPALPALPTRRAPAALELGGIEILAPADPALSVLAEALARALERALPASAARVVRRGAPERRWSALTIDLSDPGRAAEKLARVVSAAEHHALR